MLTSCGDTQLPDDSDDQSISYVNTTQHDVNASVLAATIRQQIEKSYDAYEDEANYQSINLMGTGANILSYFEKEENTSDDSAESASLMPEQERKQLYRLLMENCPELGNIDYLCIRTEWDWDNGGKYIVAVAVNYKSEIGLDSAAGKCTEMVYAFNLNGFMGNTANEETLHHNLRNMTGVALNAEPKNICTVALKDTWKRFDDVLIMHISFYAIMKILFLKKNQTILYV